MNKKLKIALFGIIALILLAVGITANLLKNPTYRSLVTIGPQQSILIQNVRVFAATGTTALENQQVLVENGRIFKIEPTTQEAPPNVHIIDGTGRTLMPGLIDFHTHITNGSAPPWYIVAPNPAHQLEAYLYAGVTTVVSMGDEINIISEISRQVEAGELPGPRIRYAGMSITKRGGHPQAAIDSYVPWPLGHLLPSFSYEMDSAADAEAAVETMAAKGASHIKLVVDDLPPGVPKLAAEEIKAIVTAAHRKGLKVVAHIGKAEDALLAVANGVDALNHGIHRGPITEKQAKELATAGIAQSPTLIVFERVAQIASGQVRFNDMHREIEPKEIIDQFSDAVVKAHEEKDFMRPWFDEVLKSRQQQRKNARTMYEAGVPIFVGTDSAIMGNIAGASIHDEMALLADAGIPAVDILLGASARPAAFLFDKPQIGTIEPGKIADLLLVDGNPLEDIAATQNIVAVIQGGRLVKRHRP